MSTIVVHHSADFDGLFCREIARKFLPEAKLIGWDFGDPPLPHPDPNDKYVVMDLPMDAPFGAKFQNGWLCFDDIPPDLEAYKEGRAQPVDRILWDNVTWIDHHASAIASHPKEIPGYRIDGVAACRLAYQWFNLYANWDPREQQPPYSLPVKQEFIDRKVNEPIAVRLAGEYDIWDKRDPNAELFQHGLRSQELTDGDWAILLHLLTSKFVEQLLAQGRCIQYAQRKQDEFISKNRSFDVTFEGLRFMAINAVRCNSLTFEATTRPDHDALMGFFWNGKTWAVSMYHAPHRKDLDLAAIAVKYGGGGHKGACGFRAAKLPFLP